MLHSTTNRKGRTGLFLAALFNRRAALALAAGAMLLAAHPASAGTNDYWNGTNGNFNDSSWSGDNPPTGTDNAVLNNGAYTVTINSDQTVNDINASNSGTYTQTAGTVNEGTNGGWFYLGQGTGSSGTYNLQGGTLNFQSTGYDANIGGSNGSNGLGTLNVSGGTLTNNAGQITVGGDSNGGVGTGLLELSAGSITNNNQLWIGDNSGSVGTFTMTGGTLTTTGDTYMGYNSNNGGGSGTFNLSGGTATLAYLAVGRGGTGTDLLNISGGKMTTGRIDVGWSGNQAGTITMSGTGVLDAADIHLGLYDGTTGTLNLNGGTLGATQILNNDGNSSGVTDVINFNGGTLQALGNSADFISNPHSGYGKAFLTQVQTGGAVIDSNGHAITINQGLVHDTTAGAAATDGGLTKIGAGTLTLNGNNTFNGGVTVNAGTLVAAYGVGGSAPTSGSLGNAQATTNVITVNSGGTLQTTTSDILGNAASNPVASVVLNSGGTFQSTNNLTTLGKVTLNGGTLTADGGTTYNTSHGSIDLNGTVYATGSGVTSTMSSINNSGTATFDLNDTGTHNTTFDTAGGATLAVTGVIANTWDNYAGSLTKTNSGTLTLTANNTYTGGTTVNGGTLNLSGVHSDGTGTLTVNSGGTVNVTVTGGDSSTDPDIKGGTYTVSANNALGSPTTIENGGTLKNNGFTGATKANNVQNGGILTIGNGANILDFGAGNTGATFDFTSLSGIAGTLSVNDWLGTPGTLNGMDTGANLDQLFIGTTQDLTTAQLMDISFNGTLGATQLSDGQVVAGAPISPAPEPGQVATLSMIGLGLGGLLLRARKRLQNPAAV